MRTHYPYFLLLITIIISVLPRATGSIVPRLTGECPHTPPGKTCLGIVSRCASDRECKWGEKCCDNGCGKTCIKVRGDFPGGGFPPYKPPVIPKPKGTCPSHVMKFRCLGKINDECQTDSDCAWFEKCCDNGCEMVCTNAEEQGFPQFPPNKPPVIPKPKGTCPSHVMKFRCLGKINDECQTDSDCAWFEKCCDNGCEMVCTDVEEQGIPKEPPYKLPELPKPGGILPTLKPQLPRPPTPRLPKIPFLTRKPHPLIIDPPVRPFPFPIPPEPERPHFPRFWEPFDPEPRPPIIDPPVPPFPFPIPPEPERPHFPRF